MVNAQNDFGPVCNPRPNVWLPCAEWDVTDGIGYLRRVKGKAVLSPGPSSCARVSCSYNAAIWWCNDNKNQFTLDSFNTIADCAQVIVNVCSDQLKVVGQNFVRPSLPLLLVPLNGTLTDTFSVEWRQLELHYPL